MTGIVLSGGENKRMGSDKAFLSLAGIPLIEHILGKLKSVFQDIIIVTNAPDRYAAYGVTVVRDEFDKRGPLTGIHSGLKHSRHPYSFIVACDMPFLNTGLIRFMAGLADGHDAVVPLVAGRPEPLHAVYGRGLLPVIEDHLRQDRRRLQDLLAGRQVRFVTELEIDQYDPARKSFRNLNTPQEYEEAACADWECRS